MNTADIFQPQDIPPSGGYSQQPFQGISLDPSQIGSDAMFIDDFALSDLELGQFFLPDDFPVQGALFEEQSKSMSRESVDPREADTSVRCLLRLLDKWRYL